MANTPKVKDTLGTSANRNASDNKVVAVDDAFFPVEATVDTTLWSAEKPFQLAVLELDPQAQGPYTEKDYQLQEVYTLPIGPESLTISTPFAVTTAATLDGIVEQHNGAPFRMISIQGTTGVLPFRSTTPYGDSFGVGTLFGGTISNALNTLSAARAVASETGNQYETVKLVSNDEQKTQTGYYQFLALRSFLESYSTRKKTQPLLRLAFLVWKEKVAYLVTPVSFDLQRQAQSALEYRYSIQMRAWKRLPIDGIATTKSPISGLVSDKVSLYNSAINRIDAARRVLRGAKKTVQSIQPDFDEAVFAPLREVALGLKDAVGLGKTLADFPTTFAKYLDKEIAANLLASTIFSAVTDPVLLLKIDQLTAAATDYTTRAGRDQSQASTSISAKDKSEGLTQDTLAISPQKRISAILTDPDNEELLTYINIDSISVSDTAKAYREAVEAKAAGKTKSDYLKLYADLQLFVADYSDKVGLGNPTFNALLGRPASAQIRSATLDDITALNALQDVLLQYRRLASIEPVDESISNAMAYVAQLAGESDITFRIPRSKFAVPFPYGGTLEKLAYMYLGDPDRWHEIATLNGLREPYVDEVGFELPLVYVGSETVQLTDVSNLYVGQSVSIRDGVARVDCKVRSILPSRNTYTVTIDKQLPGFGASAKLYGYLAGTVNSGQLIYIPSDEPLATDALDRTVPGVQDIDAFTRAAGWDFQLTSKNDLAITPDGDVKLAVGMAHIVQRLRVIFATPKGSWLHYPSFGFAAQPGMSNADLTAKEVLASANASLANDPNLTVTATTVEILGPVVRLNMEVAVRGTPTRIPISIDVR